MVEVILSFGILAVAALGIIAAFTRLMMAQSASSHQTVARIVAESVLEEMALRSPPDFGPAGFLGSEQSVTARVGQKAELVTFHYEASAEEMLPVAGMSSVGGLPDMGDVWEIRVKIWWQTDAGKGPQGAVEKGKRSLEVKRLTYVET